MSLSKENKRALRRPFETGGFLLLKGVVPLLPRNAVVVFAKLAGWFATILPLPETHYGMKNLDVVFGDSKSKKEKKLILATSFTTFCQTMMDVFWFSKNPEKRIPKYVEIENSPGTELLFSDEAAVCITAHMGSWEIIGQAVALQGADLASIAATIKNPTVDRILIEQRERTGQTIIPQKGALKTLISRFRKNGKAAFVLDQYTSAKEGGIMVNFLGLPMSVSSAPATLSYRTGTKILLGFCLPQKKGHYRVFFPRIISPPIFDKKENMEEIVLKLTQEIEDEISEQIMKHPNFWLWSYKHWRRTHGENYPKNYPVY
ncbi:MAG TPA: lysophospholipid acyltransferase family protein [Pontiella sp.]